MRLTLVLLGWLGATPPVDEAPKPPVLPKTLPRVPVAPPVTTPPAVPALPPSSIPTTNASVDAFIADLPGLIAPCTLPLATEVDGMRVSQRSCVSSRPVAELRALFEKRFRDAGLYAADEAQDIKLQAGVQVSGFDTENLLSYTALLQPSGKNTTVVMARADMNGLQRKTVEGPPIAPLVPGATDVTTFRLEAVQAMTYSVHASPAEIKAFYRGILSSTGWKEDEELVFSKGGQKLSLTVSPGVTERYVMVQLQTAPPGK